MSAHQMRLSLASGTDASLAPRCPGAGVEDRAGSGRITAVLVTTVLVSPIRSQEDERECRSDIPGEARARSCAPPAQRLPGPDRIPWGCSRMTVLVTGGAGFIGSHVVDLLVGQG